MGIFIHYNFSLICNVCSKDIDVRYINIGKNNREQVLPASGGFYTTKWKNDRNTCIKEIESRLDSVIEFHSKKQANTDWPHIAYDRETNDSQYENLMKDRFVCVECAKIANKVDEVKRSK